MNEIPLEAEDLRLLLRITTNLELAYLVADPARVLTNIKHEIAESTMRRGLAASDVSEVQRVQLNRLSARVRRALGEPVDEDGRARAPE